MIKALKVTQTGLGTQRTFIVTNPKKMKRFKVLESNNFNHKFILTYTKVVKIVK